MKIITHLIKRLSIMKLSNIEYDKVKLLYEFSKIIHFIEKHAKDDAKEDKEFSALLLDLEKQVGGHIEKLHKLI
jgi:hypothetical protein